MLLLLARSSAASFHRAALFQEEIDSIPGPVAFRLVLLIFIIFFSLFPFDFKHDASIFFLLSFDVCLCLSVFLCVEERDLQNVFNREGRRRRRRSRGIISFSLLLLSFWLFFLSSSLSSSPFLKTIHHTQE